MVDTGSTFSLIQESCWNQLCHQEQYQPSEGQSFLLANGQRQTAIGKVKWKCEIQEQSVDLILFIMQDADLTVPVNGFSVKDRNGARLSQSSVQPTHNRRGYESKYFSLPFHNHDIHPYYAFLPRHFLIYLQ